MAAVNSNTTADKKKITTSLSDIKPLPPPRSSGPPPPPPPASSSSRRSISLDRESRSRPSKAGQDRPQEHDTKSVTTSKNVSIKENPRQSRTALRSAVQQPGVPRSKSASRTTVSQESNLKTNKSNNHVGVESRVSFVNASKSACRTNVSKLNIPNHNRGRARSSTSVTSSTPSESRPDFQQTYLVRSFNEIRSVIIANAPEADKVDGFDPSEVFRAQVRRAIMENKIFACNPRYAGIRKALESRGWVEKFEHDFTSIEYSSRTSLTYSDNFSADGDEDDSDNAWMERMLRHCPPDLIYKQRRDKLLWDTLLPRQILNQHLKSPFSNKISIADRIQDSQWFSEPGMAHCSFPRCYRLGLEEEKIAFTLDYRLTACLSLLQWTVDTYEAGGNEEALIGTYGSPAICLDFALTQVNNYARIRRHEDLDQKLNVETELPWELFLSRYYNAVYLNRRLSNEGNPPLTTKYEAAKTALKNIQPYWPQLNVDGTNNIWICKPGDMSKGKGIVILNQMEKILSISSDSPHLNWVVQKYIERPLLIHSTKFDIRQWFVITSWRPMTVWMYKQCYLRFCTKPFGMEDFSERIHLCNNSVQSRYEVSDDRNPFLPKESMWDSTQFRGYLKESGKEEMWDSKIYPGMRQGILGVLLSAENQIEDEYRRNSFQIYGADFMLSDDFTPWIIEINGSPCLDYTTDVTARLCQLCMEDCIKVVIDLRNDPNANTGDFELIYHSTSSSMPFKAQDPNESELVIQGRAVPARPMGTSKMELRPVSSNFK